MRGQYAGFTSRLIAFIIDLVLITLINVVLAWIFSVVVNLIGIDLAQCRLIELDNTFTSFSDFFQTVWCILFLIGIPLTSFLILVGYPIIFWTLIGQTIGKYTMGLRVVRMDGNRITLFTSIRRVLGYAVSILFFGLGFVWILINNQRQGWHDKIAGTCVIYTWDARHNERMQGRLSRFTQKFSERRQSSKD